MPEKKPWSPEEDDLLKSLRDNPKPMKWSKIAVYLHEEKKMPKRSGKQCRERYSNHLNPENCRQEWKYEEQRMLFDYHDTKGAKWSEIGKLLSGRSDNCVKNKFYSKLKKTVRKLNIAIEGFFSKKHSEIQSKILYKIVQAYEDRFKNHTLTEEFTGFVTELKSQLQNESFREAQFEEQEMGRVQDLIKKLNKFNKEFKKKRKSKKSAKTKTGPPIFCLSKDKFRFAQNDSQSEEKSQFDEESEKQEQNWEQSVMKGSKEDMFCIDTDSVDLSLEKKEFVRKLILNEQISENIEGFGFQFCREEDSLVNFRHQKFFQFNSDENFSNFDSQY